MKFSSAYVVHGMWLGCLALYIWLGMFHVPFHADEATVIWTSRDFEYLIAGNFDRLTYHDPPIDLHEQQLRLLNGTVDRNLIGFSRLLVGHSLEDLNVDWDWYLDWNANIQNGAKPSESLLILSRAHSYLMTIGSLMILFTLGWQISGKWGAYFSSFIYTFNPAVLLNGRRAMFEGSHLFFTTLAVLLALAYWKNRKWWLTFAIGITAGLAISSKHPSIIVLVGAFLPFLFQKYSRRSISQLLTIGIITLITFYILNPIWWGNPLARIEHVLNERSHLLQLQINQFGGYASTLEKISGFWDNAFAITPQYFEIPAWADYIHDEIIAYHQTGLSGIHYGTIGGIIIFLVALVGLWRVWQSRNWVIISWAVVVLIIIGWVTPFNWQRYYLPTLPPISILFGAGCAYFIQKISHLRQKSDPQ